MKRQYLKLLRTLEFFRGKKVNPKFDAFKSHAYTPKNRLDFAFMHYYNQLEHHPEFMIKFNTKMLKALEIYSGKR